MAGRLISVLTLVATTLALPFSHVSRTTRDLRIMPMGASITYGQASSDGNGYRNWLRAALTSKSYTVRFLGADHNGNMANNNVQAVPGATISQVHTHYLTSQISTTNPNVILINAGTNNCYPPNNIPQSQSVTDFTALLADIKQYNPTSLVVISTLLPHLDPTEEACITQLNPKLLAVAARARQAGQKVVTVDMHSIIPKSEIHTDDKTHPTDRGYAMMAYAWYGVIDGNAGMIG